MSSLATFILTKSEENDIVAVGENAKNVTDDVITIYSNSKDKTVALADVQRATVCFRAWKNDFADRENFAPVQAKTESARCLDVDKRLNEALIASVKVVLAKALFIHQYFMERKSVTFGRTFNLKKICSHEGGVAGV